MSQLDNELINDKGVCRTAPATLGLLKKKRKRRKNRRTWLKVSEIKLTELLIIFYNYIYVFTLQCGGYQAEIYKYIKTKYKYKYFVFNLILNSVM